MNPKGQDYGVLWPQQATQLEPVTSLTLGYKTVFQCLGTPDQQETTLYY